MGSALSKNAFPVKGRTVLITGGSEGMGLEVGRQLAAKGANVIIVARNLDKLKNGIQYISQGALDSDTQRFHYISADLINPAESSRIISEATSWNGDSPPDIVWCCAGSSYPTLFIDTPIEQLSNQMNSNYFTAAYTAHATLRSWLLPLRNGDPDSSKQIVASTAPATTFSSASSVQSPPLPRHLIFTASFLSFYTIAGYSPYSPTKAALRSLSDTLSNEMKLYSGAHPDKPSSVQIHTIFPATIFTASYEAENRVKSELTRKLEEDDAGQTAAEVAKRSIAGLERGEELVTTTWLTRLVMCGVLGGSARGGFLKGFVDYLLSCLMGFVMVLVRGDSDRKVRAWGKNYGSSGMRA